MINIIGKRKWFFLISAIVIIPGVISLAIFGLEPGIDFSSGTTMTLRFDPAVEQEQLRQEMANLGYDKAIIQFTDGDFFIRIGEVTAEERQALTAGLESGLNTSVTVRDYYAVSPIIAAETGRDAAIAVGGAALAMLVYIAWAFRRMPKPFRWGICAIVALIHDVAIVIGIFSILGWIAGVQINALFIIGMLTVVGYSVNNTVVVFDRIRENVSKGISKDFEVTVNASILETLGRSLNTSLTTMFVILAIYLFGGVTIQYFILVLLIGVVAGTYSSMLIAGPLLVVWDKISMRRIASRNVA
jgi:preprotein translocase subunit SecF